MKPGHNTLKPIYDKREWVLAICEVCHKENYVEPHGTTAQCSRCHGWTEHQSIPYSCRNGWRNQVNMRQLREEFPLLPVLKNKRA